MKWKAADEISSLAAHVVPVCENIREYEANKPITRTRGANAVVFWVYCDGEEDAADFRHHIQESHTEKADTVFDATA